MNDIYSSIFSSIDAFVFRCRNDDDYTMEVIEGSVDRLTGYHAKELLNNSVISFVGMMLDEDAAKVIPEIDAAIEERAPWDVTYRIMHANGRHVWVRERGAAIFEQGELKYLEGLIVAANAETLLRGEIEKMLVESQQSGREIAELTEQIVNSVKQLKILSINARVEAARSGEAGRGFAIVAEEMNKLATANGEWATVIAEKLREQEARKAA